MGLKNEVGPTCKAKMQRLYRRSYSVTLVQRNQNSFDNNVNVIGHIDRLLCPDIIQFIRSEMFLRELPLSSTLSPNPKSSHSVDPQFSHKLPFYVH